MSDLLDRLENCHVTGSDIQESIQIAAHQPCSQPLLGPLPICAFVVQILSCTNSLVLEMKCVLTAANLRPSRADPADGRILLAYSNRIS